MEMYADLLENAASELNIEINSDQMTQLLAYHALLMKWNKAYNLTAVRDPKEMVTRHLVDSLTILPHLKGTNLLDVGCGGGLPGLIIAIMKPELKVTLLDSNGKKTRFCQQAKMELKLSNVTVQHCRLESYQPELKHDCITSRAFATLKDMVEKSVSCCAMDGYYLAMKGVYPEQELSELPENIIVEQIQSIKTPGQQEERHLAILRQGA